MFLNANDTHPERLLYKTSSSPKSIIRQFCCSLETTEKVVQQYIKNGYDIVKNDSSDVNHIRCTSIAANATLYQGNI